MKRLRIEGESDEEFLHRAEKAAVYAGILTRACLANHLVRELIAHGEYSEERLRRSPVVRVEFEEAIAWGGIGETLYATRSKHWATDRTFCRSSRMTSSTHIASPTPTNRSRGITAGSSSGSE